MTAILLPAIAMTFAASFMLTVAARRLAPRLGFIDAPDGQRKRHRAPTPVLGGASIYFSILITMVVGLLIKADWLGGANRSTALMASCSLFFFLGLIDDKRPLPAKYKFIGQLIASIPFAIYGRSITHIGLFGLDITLGYGGVLVTILWLVTCSNIINLIDGLDGLASSISIVVLGTMAALSFRHGNPELACAILVTCAAVCGFLIHNLPPAKIFLGDSGALMLGFLVGAFSIESAVKRATVFTLVGTLVLVSIPFFDTVVAMVRRKLKGKGIGEADRGHIHHRLQDMGLSRKQTLVVIVMLSMAMAVVAFVADLLRNDVVAIVLCASLLASLVVSRVFGHYEATMLVRHTRAIGSLLYDLLRMSGSRVLLVRLQDAEVMREQDAWDLVCARIARQGIQSLEFICRDEADKLSGFLSWRSDARVASQSSDWELQFSANPDQHTRVILRVCGSTKQAESLRAANDLFIFCDSLCRNRAIVESAKHALQSSRPGHATDGSLPMFDPLQEPAHDRESRPADGEEGRKAA